MRSPAESGLTPIEIGLTAAIVTVEAEAPSILITGEHANASLALFEVTVPHGQRLAAPAQMRLGEGRSLVHRKSAPCPT